MIQTIVCSIAVGIIASGVSLVASMLLTAFDSDPTNGLMHWKFAQRIAVVAFVTAFCLALVIQI